MGRGLSAWSRELVARIREVFAREHPLGPRRVAYSLFGNRAGRMAKKISQLCGRMIEDGLLPLDWYDDSSRQYVQPYVVEDINDLVALNRGAAPFDPWRSQPVRVVIWSEKACGGTLDPILSEYKVPFLNTSGFNSRKIVMETADATRRDPRRLNILYVGDHDATGLRMSNADLPRRLTKYGAQNWTIRRIAITRADVTTFRRHRLTDPVKPTDPNRAWYLHTTGLTYGVELEALAAPDLRHRVENAVRGCIEDLAAWDRSVAASTAVRESWQSYVDAWPRPVIAYPGSRP